MGNLVFLAYMLAVPAALFAVVASFGWRYRKVLANSMTKSTSATAVMSAVPGPSLPSRALVPLQVEKTSGRQVKDSHDPAVQARGRADAVTRAANRCFLIAGGLFWSIVVALHVWAAQLLWNRGFVLPLVVIFAALPGLTLLLTVVSRSWKTWAKVLAVYAALTVVVILAIGWHLGSVPKAAGVALSIANVYAWPVIAIPLLVQRGLRTLMIGIIPVLLYIVAGVAALEALAPDVLQLARSEGMRLPAFVMFAIGAAVVPASVWVFLRILRSGHRLEFAILLAVVGIGGVVLDEVLHPRFPLGPLAGAVPVGVLQCAIIWLFFKGIIRLQAIHWLPSQALQSHLCWSFLGLYSVIFFNAQLVGISADERNTAYLLLGAGFITYLVGVHVLLQRAWKARCAVVPKRLLLLRVFNAADKRERLLDTLEDTWRRVGRVDLVGGTDLAMRTLASVTLEYFLLRRLDTEFLRTAAEVDRRIDRLRSQLEGDLRYPVNEIFCYANTWQAAVMRLALESDVVLLDLRGFTSANLGCKFELTNLVWYVPLARVVVLIDSTTDEKALHDVAQAAWAQLPCDSPNVAAAAPRLRIVSSGKPSETALVPAALFGTAFQPCAVG